MMPTITYADVAALIREKLGRNLSAHAALDEDSALDELGMSSMESWDIIFTLEERLDVEFDPDEASAARTIGQLVALCGKASSL
jgi:acyl carrier protein